MEESADKFFSRRRVLRKKRETALTYEQWRALGQRNNWVGPAICLTHDGYPTTELEDIEFEEGGDPCIHMMRLYADPQEARLVEENHSPSVWRNNYPSLL